MSNLIVWAGGEHLGHMLTTARRGERVRDFDKDAMGDSSFVVSGDAVVTDTTEFNRPALDNPSILVCAAVHRREAQRQNAAR